MALIAMLLCTAALSAAQQMQASIRPEAEGTTMRYVAYNQGYLVPGGNVAAWWEYSGVNGARLWVDLRSFVKTSWFERTLPIPADEAGFESNRRLFLQDPQKYMPLDSVKAVAGRIVPSTNTMVLDYALETMKDLGIDVVIQSSIDRKYYDASWASRWELWMRFYTLAYYLNAKGGVKMMALCNEPDHRNAGPMPLETWLTLAATAKDALHSAIPDGLFVGPVTAGNNVKWWAAASKAGLPDILSTHSYNRPASGYKGRVTKINEVQRANRPDGKAVPVVFTETGRWMNAKLINHEETMDSPSLFTEWAGEYVVNMMEGCYGIWAFKFANTVSRMYPRGIKSGHHLCWRGTRFLEDAWPNLALGAKVECSDGSPDASLITDGSKSSGWICSSAGPKWFSVELPKVVETGGFVLYSGSEGGEFTAPDRVKGLSAEYMAEDGSWQPLDIPGGNYFKYAQYYCSIEPAVKAKAVRISIPEGDARIREFKLFPAGSISKAQECYDVSGVQRTAEVVRLFAKGFKGQRPLYKADVTQEDENFDVCASRDDASGLRYVWLVKRGEGDLDLSLDLGAFGVKPGSRMVCERVSADSYGEASILQADANGQLIIVLPERSVNLLTIPERPSETKEMKPASFFGVCLASKKAGRPEVEMNARETAHNKAAVLSFDLSSIDRGSIGRAVLDLSGISNSSTRQRLHLYAFDGIVKPCRWSKVPHLSGKESLATGFDGHLKVTGQISFGKDEQHRCLDVSELLKKSPDGKITFLLLREAREYGDDYDNGISTRLLDARIIIW